MKDRSDRSDRRLTLSTRRVASRSQLHYKFGQERMSKDLHASMRAAAKLTAEDTDEMDNTHTVVRAAYAARVEDDGNC